MEKSIFPLLGNRNYIHSTTLWRYVVEQLVPADIINARLVCKQKIQTQVDIYCNEGECATIKDSDADIYVITDNGRYVYSFKSNGEVVNNSISYDEDGLLGEHELYDNERVIILRSVSREWLINSIVAANKALLLALLPNKGMSSWLIGKINLDYSALEKAVAHGDLRLQLDNVLANQYTKVSVYVGDKKYGVLESARKRR